MSYTQASSTLTLQLSVLKCIFPLVAPRLRVTVTARQEHRCWIFSRSGNLCMLTSAVSYNARKLTPSKHCSGWMKLLQSGNKNDRVDERHVARDELAREQQHSTTEQEAVATWPFRNTQPLLERYRNGQVAPASCSGVDRRPGRFAHPNLYFAGTEEAERL